MVRASIPTISGTEGDGAGSKACAVFQTSWQRLGVTYEYSCHEYPKVRALIMSGLPEEQYARNVLRADGGYLIQGRLAERNY